MGKIRKFSLIIILLLLVVTTMISVSYAYFTMAASVNNKISTNATMPTCATLSFPNESKLTLSGNTSAPVSDAKVISTASNTAHANDYLYTFSVTNNCGTSVDLAFVIASSSKIAASQIKYILINTSEGMPSSGKYLSAATNKTLTANQKADLAKQGKTVTSAYVLKTQTMTIGQTINFKLYMWVDHYEGNTSGANDNTTQNGSFSGYIVALTPD